MTTQFTLGAGGLVLYNTGDTIPTTFADGSKLPAGFRAINKDTGEVSMFDGGSTWFTTFAAGSGDASQTTLLAVKAKTDNLPASPAASGDVTSAVTAIEAHGDANWGGGGGSTEYDGVYVDSVNGTAGTGTGVGDPNTPSSNIPDAKTIAAARKVNKLILANPVDGFTLTADLQGYEVVGVSTNGDTTAGIDFAGFNVQGSVFRHVLVGGNVACGNGAEFWFCHTTLVYTGVPRLHNCFIYDLTAANGFGDKAFLYDCYSDEDNAAIIDCAYGTFHVTGWHGYVEIHHVASSYNTFFGNSGAQVIFTSSDTGGTVEVNGDCKIYDSSSGTTVIDQTNRPRPEVPVNITAIVASETNVLDLEDTGIHYTVDSLVLKCVDPGANTVNVRLYQQVNGVLTNTHTFAITTSNYSVYRNLADLFNVYILAGDKIKVTVQATAGGPYAVTGSYAARSA